MAVTIDIHWHLDDLKRYDLEYAALDVQEILYFKHLDGERWTCDNPDGLLETYRVVARNAVIATRLEKLLDELFKQPCLHRLATVKRI
ncbi:MAG: hypothetical protein AAGI46_03295 [Planctomycetota bacterium]